MHSLRLFRSNIISLLILLLSVLPWNTGAQALCPYPTPKYEVRAVWLATIGGLDWPHVYARSSSSIDRQKQELCDILDRLRRGGVNTVLLQTRVRGTLIYPSNIEPWDGCMSGTPGRSPGYDPLAFAIEECHKRGMEVQAWVVTIPVGKWNGHGCKTMRRMYPSLLRRIGDEGYMKPELNATADYLAGICGEIVRNYDIDGIHLDYIRYPETGKRNVGIEEGRRNVTRIVERISNTVKGIKPWVKMSCSPIGKHDDLVRYSSRGWNARTAVCQDAQAWLRDGLMDELLPMMYFRGNNFFPFALDWLENCHGRIIVPGLGIYFLSPEEQNWNLDDIKREMYFLRNHGMGHAYFRSKFFTDNTKGLYDFVAGEFDNIQTFIPPLTWISDAKPLPPAALELIRGDDGDKLEWNGAVDMSNGNYLTYNIYRSNEYPVDVNDAGNLVAVRHTGKSIIIPHMQGEDKYHYAVAAMDRYGNESTPVMTASPYGYETKPVTREHLLPNDGRILKMPETAKLADAQYLIIENIQGIMVVTVPYTNDSVNISQLPDGMYRIRSLNKKGVSHRLGCTIIRRFKLNNKAN